jgi:hypothetical protein
LPPPKEHCKSNLRRRQAAANAQAHVEEQRQEFAARLAAEQIAARVQVEGASAVAAELQQHAVAKAKADVEAQRQEFAARLAAEKIAAHVQLEGASAVATAAKAKAQAEVQQAATKLLAEQQKFSADREAATTKLLAEQQKHSADIEAVQQKFSADREAAATKLLAEEQKLSADRVAVRVQAAGASAARRKIDADKQLDSEQRLQLQRMMEHHRVEREQFTTQQAAFAREQAATDALIAATANGAVEQAEAMEARAKERVAAAEAVAEEKARRVASAAANRLQRERSERTKIVSKLVERKIARVERAGGVLMRDQKREAREAAATAAAETKLAVRVATAKAYKNGVRDAQTQSRHDDELDGLECPTGASADSRGGDVDNADPSDVESTTGDGGADSFHDCHDGSAAEHRADMVRSASALDGMDSGEDGADAFYDCPDGPTSMDGGVNDAPECRDPGKRHRHQCPSSPLIQTDKEDVEAGVALDDDTFYIDHNVDCIGSMQQFTVCITGGKLREQLRRWKAGEKGVRLKSRGMLLSVIRKVHPLIEGWLVGFPPETVTATVLTFARKAFPDVVRKMDGVATGKNTQTREFTPGTLAAWQAVTKEALESWPEFRIRIKDRRLDVSRHEQRQKWVEYWRHERKGSRQTHQFYGDNLAAEAGALYDVHARSTAQATALRGHTLEKPDASNDYQRAHRQRDSYGENRRTYPAERKAREAQLNECKLAGLSEHIGSRKLVRPDKSVLPEGAPAIGKHEAVSTIGYAEKPTACDNTPSKFESATRRALRAAAKTIGADLDSTVTEAFGIVHEGMEYLGVMLQRMAENDELTPAAKALIMGGGEASVGEGVPLRCVGTYDAMLALWPDGCPPNMSMLSFWLIDMLRALIPEGRSDPVPLSYWVGAETWAIPLLEEVIFTLIGEHEIRFPRYGTCIKLRVNECTAEAPAGCTTEAGLAFTGDHKMLASLLGVLGGSATMRVHWARYTRLTTWRYRWRVRLRSIWNGRCAHCIGRCRTVLRH